MPYFGEILHLETDKSQIPFKLQYSINQNPKKPYRYVLNIDYWKLIINCDLIFVLWDFVDMQSLIVDQISNFPDLPICDIRLQISELVMNLTPLSKLLQYGLNTSFRITPI